MRRTLVAMLVVASLPVTLHAQTNSSSLNELGNLKVDNCGLNVAVFTLDWFGVPIDLYRLQDELEIGAHWERPASMLSLKRSFEAKGLNVKAYKDATLDEVAAEVDTEHICLLHVTLGKDPKDPKAGHFYLVAATQNGKVLLVDAGKTNQWLTVDEFKHRLQQSFTGYFVSVSRPSASRRASAQ